MNDKAKVFEAYNARNLRPEQVATTFVPSVNFETLAKPRHSLVVGPRGSGKTTLLKMLQQAALETWSHSEAEAYRDAIDYTGVYVPADITWSMQLNFLGGGRLDPETKDVLARAAFTTHVIRALVLAMRDRVDVHAERPYFHRRLPIVESTQAAIVLQLGDAWRVPVTVATFRSLALALSRRLQQIGEIANQEQRRHTDGREERLSSHAFLDISFLPAISHAIDVFEDAVGTREHWAFLFDELEIAPEWIRSELIALLRSTDQRLLFKLTLSPYKPEETQASVEVTAEERQDHDTILLWYAHKEDSYPFSESLWRSITEARFGKAMAAVDVLGHAPYETTPAEWAAEGTAYVQGTHVARVLEDLWELDPTFREYLQNRGIDARFLSEVSVEDRAAVVRKIAPIAYFRREYLREMLERVPTKGRVKAQKQMNAALRSRKNPTVYSGVETVFACCEGNPRMLLGLADELLRQIDRGSVEPSRQARAITAASRTFGATIRNAPVPYTTGVGVLAVLRKVGDFIFDQIIRETFNPEPPGSFIVDSHIQDDVQHALGVALNIGAIVYLPDKDAEFLLKSLRGKRFRLSYMLSVNFKNPLRLGRAVALSTILGAVPADGLQLKLGESAHES